LYADRYLEETTFLADDIYEIPHSFGDIKIKGQGNYFKFKR